VPFSGDREEVSFPTERPKAAKGKGTHNPAVLDPLPEARVASLAGGDTVDVGRLVPFPGRWGNDQPQSTFTPCIEIVFRSVDVVASIFHLGYSRGGPLWRGAISALESRIHGNAVQFLGINPAMRESMESEFAG